jgi:hypothetical protein
MGTRHLILGILTGLGWFALAAVPVWAQPSPSEMRSGTVTGSAGLQTLTLFNVPAGSQFVLTDLEWCPDMNLPYGPADVLRLSLKLRTATTDRYGWWAVIYPAFNGERHTINVPLVEHWTTGIVFGSGEPVRFEIGDFASFISWRVNWSGYVVSGMASDAGEIEPEGRGLALQGSPNPAEGDAWVRFLLPSPGKVLVAIYDVSGRQIRSLYDGALTGGEHALPWDGRDDDGRPVGSGVYFARLETAEATEMQKLSRIR